MTSQQNHEMQLGGDQPSGAELWYCPTCGRQFLLSWPPDYQKTIINAGDESARHSGGKGGLSIGPLQIGEAEDLEFPEGIRTALEKILRSLDSDDQLNEFDPYS